MVHGRDDMVGCVFDVYGKRRFVGTLAGPRLVVLP
jgi:hypothetical protein